MSQSLGTIGAAVIAQEALPILVANFPLLKSIATDFSAEPVLENQSVISRIPSIGTLSDYDETNGYVPQDATLTDVTVTLDKHKHATFSLNDKEINSTNVNLIETLARDAALTLGAGIMADWAAVVALSANYANSTAVGAMSAVNRNTIVTVNTALNKRNVSKDRFGVVNADFYGQLKQDQYLVNMFFGGLGITPSNLPVIDGVTMSEYSALPSTGNLVGVIGDKSSICMASRVPSDKGYADLPLNGRISVVTDEKTGLSVQTREVYDIVKGKRYVTFTLIYGFGVGNSACLQRITL